MPAAAHSASVTYEQIPAPTCYTLTLSHTGQGSDPVATPANSIGCADNQYVEGASIALIAAPDTGWQVDSWTGTTNNSSTELTNAVTMPAAAHAASVIYTEIPPSLGWSAYNDASWTAGQTTTKITTYSYDTNTTGLLKDYATGADTTVTAQITYNGSIAKYPSTGTETASGTDAYNTFHGITDMVGVINYSSTAGWWVDVTFTGLDPSKTYTFAVSANRAGGSTYLTRVSKFAISDIVAATATSTDGVTLTTTTLPNDTAAFSTGENTSTGYVARWITIQPGSDGDFKVRTEANSGYYGYGPSVFLLKEEPSGPLPCYALTLSHNGNGGDPTASPAKSEGCETGQYVAGQTIQLTATPDMGYQVGSWTGTTNDGSTATTNTVSMPAAAHSASVNYVRTPTTVTFQVGLSGYAGTQDTYILQTSPTTAFGNEVTIEWDTEDIGGDVNSQKFALLRFDDIFGSGAGQIPVGSTIVSARVDYVVSNAAPTPANVNGVLVDWDETVTYDTFGAEAGVQEADYGVLVATATATPVGSYNIDVKASLEAWVNDPASNQGWIFRPTNTDGADVHSSESATEDSRPKLTVQYYPPAGPTCYALTITKQGDGSLPTADPANSVGCPSGQYVYNETITLSGAAPATGWHIAGWSGTQNNASVAATNTVTMPANAHSAGVVYAIDTFTLSYTAGAGGTLTGKTSQTVNYGEDGTPVTAVPNTGYHFVKWSDDSTANPRTDLDVMANVSVTANFAADTFTLIAGNDGNGTVTLNPTGGIYDNSTTVTLTSVPNAGYMFSSWSGTNAGDIINTAGVFTIVMNANKSVTANFEPALPSDLTCETYNFLTPGSAIRTYGGWADDGTGPVVTAGNGLKGSTGLAPDSNIYNWLAHPFNWNATDLQKFIAQQDFKTDGSGNFDDDRLAWTINGNSTTVTTDSNYQFGAQLEIGKIVTYWSATIGSC